MFNLFKKNKVKKTSLENWDINVDTGFNIINNPDSIQYVNEDASKVIYFSILETSDKSVITNDIFPAEPEIKEAANGWQLKGVKKSADQLLVCVISFKNKDDSGWAKDFFNAIKHRGNL